MKFFTTLSLCGILAASAYSERMLSKTETKSVVETAASTLQQRYVFEEKANQIAETLLKNFNDGKYDNLLQSKFAEKMTEDMRSVVNDGHLYAVYEKPTPAPQTEEKKEEIDPQTSWWLHQEGLKARNYGWERYEMLPGNVGYVENTGFLGEQQAYERCASIMNFLSSCDAIIIDLRKNGGGDGRLGHLLASYFFPAGNNRWLLSNENRSNGTYYQEWSYTYVPGKKMPNTPLYILTSGGTFSAAEAFAYAMQANKRAITVGENTGGGAHSGTMRDCGNHIKVFVPSGRVSSPITKSNWEAVGVKADVECPADKAVEFALMDFFNKKKNDDNKYIAANAKWYAEYFNNYEKNDYPKESVLKNCAGNYEDGRSAAIKNGKLYYVTPGGTELEMAYLKDDTFYGVGPNVSQQYGDLRIKFNGFKNGKVKTLSMAVKDPGPKPPNSYDVKRVK